MKKQEPQPFNDGIVSICTVENAAPPGDAPVEKLVPRLHLRFQRRMIGYGRYFTALEHSVRVDLLLRVPYREGVSTQDGAIPSLDGHGYHIVEVQVPPEVKPPVMDLSLQRIDQKFEIQA